RIDRACGQPCFENDVTITKLEPWGTVGQPTGGSQVTLIALKRLSLPGPPWIGIFFPLRTTYWWVRSVASSGMPFERRSSTDPPPVLGSVPSASHIDTSWSRHSSPA